MFGESLTAVDQDIFVTKLDSSGTKVWQSVATGGTWANTFAGIDTDSSGNVFI
ncbi:MAG: hypothetical protein H6767_09360 [Candidatus Peribacteria bacterium]|nr:MAG: hypothetical protein H6767_09360 [Candidatus Peribacteria bacterium]